MGKAWKDMTDEEKDKERARKEKKRQLDKITRQITELNTSIETLQEIESDLNDQRLKMIVPNPDKYYDYVIGHWECKKSPIGECVYDKVEDPAYDDCIFCSNPYERQ